MEETLKFFDECRQIVDDQLDRLVPTAAKSPQRLHEAIRWSLFAGGKRFRPALLMAVGKTFGACPEKLFRTAAAIEMIHTYSLIHDDLPSMDNDDMRRGRETCHKKFDEATAILAGDALQVLAFRAISDDDENLEPEVRVMLISEIAEAAGTPHGMVAGQCLDLESEGKAVSIQMIERIHMSKTGALIHASAKAGAIISGGRGEELLPIVKYGWNLGLLFQITDDLLDITQTSDVLGKTAGKDISAEKATYPGFYGMDESQKMAEKVHADILDSLKNIDRDTGLLRQLADFILLRKS
jgi:geranylgeranyl pyrophosphate synthase